MKKIFMIICVIVAIYIIAMSIFDITVKTYSTDDFTIKMRDGFKYEKQGEYSSLFTSINLAVVIDKLAFTSIDQELGVVGSRDFTVDKYIDEHEKYYHTKEDFLNDGNITYRTYEVAKNGKILFYLESIYKTDDAFWAFTFACYEKEKNIYKDLFIEWAKSVSFK